MLELTLLVLPCPLLLPQVAASLEEQAFAEAWGSKAKAVFTLLTLSNLSATDEKLMGKINKIGVANLVEADRVKVCLRPIFSNQEFFFFFLISQVLYLNIIFPLPQYNTILNQMESIYSTAKVRPEPNVTWSLEPGEIILEYSD